MRENSVNDAMKCGVRVEEPAPASGVTVLRRRSPGRTCLELTPSLSCLCGRNDVHVHCERIETIENLSAPFGVRRVGSVNERPGDEDV